MDTKWHLTENQKKEFSLLMTDIWNLIKAYGNPEDTVEYYDEMIRETDKVIQKHESTVGVFARRFGYGVIYGLEKRCKEGGNISG